MRAGLGGVVAEVASFSGLLVGEVAGVVLPGDDGAAGAALGGNVGPVLLPGLRRWTVAVAGPLSDDDVGPLR